MSLLLRDWPRAALTLARTFGLRGGIYRAIHEGRRLTGSFRSAPRHAPASYTPLARDPFVVNAAALASATDRAAAVERGDRVAEGYFPAFGWEWRSFPSNATEWSRHFRTGDEFAPGLDWWEVPHTGLCGGDIKDVWEPGRFGWVYDLVRAYLISGDDVYARAFQDRFTSWLKASPPFRGPQWACGQEVAIRAVALRYAEANLAASPALTETTKVMIAQTLAASGERIADALCYAISQKNNHAISEATGLVVLGHRFTGQHPEALSWLERGHARLDSLVPEQMADDGWYIQHSFNYLRLALDQCVVAQRVLRSSGRSLSAGTRQRIGNSVELLLSVIDSASGVVPNHGANDGALVHPISLADYRDFRPVLTAVGATFDLSLPPELKPDSEVLAWLAAPAPAVGDSVPDGVRQGSSGWAVARVDRTAVFLRAGRYRSRPGHLDPLHVDVRMCGSETVVDPGTFAYNAPPPWRNALATAAVHNGPVLDDREPGVKGPRFLWYLWPEAEIVSARWSHGTATLVAEVPGRLRRTILVTGDEVSIEDQVLAAGAGKVTVHWLLHPHADGSQAIVEGDSEVVVPGEGSPLGWFSPRYGERVPGRCIRVTRAAHLGARLRTRFVAIPPRANMSDGAGDRLSSDSLDCGTIARVTTD